MSTIKAIHDLAQRSRATLMADAFGAVLLAGMLIVALFIPAL